MSYITQSDLLKVISQDELDQILQGEDPSLVPDCLAIAESEMIQSLSRYDLAVGLTMTGSTRDSLLVVRLADIALYHMYSRISLRDIPTLRENRYNQAIKLLDSISKGEREVKFPVKPDSNNNSTFLKWGSRSNSSGFDFFSL